MYEVFLELWRFRAGGKCLVFEDLSHGTHYASQSQSVQRNPNNCDGRSHTTTGVSFQFMPSIFTLCSTSV